MRSILYGILLLAACGTPVVDGGSAPYGPGSSTAKTDWPIIDTQDHRDVRSLLAFMTDTSANVRARAALAFASVGDSDAVPALLHALNDPDPTVRANAAFAFGFCGDSTDVHRLVERYSPEENAAVRGRIAEAVGRCGRRAGADLLLRRTLLARADTLGVLRGLFFATTTGSTDTSHVRYALSLITGHDAELDAAALQVCARCAPALLKPFTRKLLDVAMMMPDEGEVEMRLPLLNALGRTGDKDAFIRLQETLMNDPEPRLRAMALKGIGRFEEPRRNELVLNALTDSSGMVRDQAVEEVLKLKELPDGETLWTMAQRHADPRVKIPLYGLVLRTADADTRRTCRMLLKSMLEQGEAGPYLNAALIRARMRDPDGNVAAGLAEPLMKNTSAPVERLAAFESAFDVYPERSTARIELLQQVFMPPYDPGLVAAASERLINEEPGTISVVLKDAMLAPVRNALHPIRDLETRQLLDAVVARRDGMDTPVHASPPFNHPIDSVRLAHITTGTRYRIVTSHGSVVVELEPEAAPGSCVAFDSLVSAGYYNGKFFHRVVPDFVAQGGCPRGDGYGGMPWSLRTEVGLQGFTTGAVGLASAGKDTESCQFFIMLADAPHLDGRYTRFAHVVSGMDVAWKLRVGDGIQQVERIGAVTAP